MMSVRMSDAISFPHLCGQTAFFPLFQNKPYVPSELWDSFYPKLNIDKFMFFHTCIQPYIVCG